MAAILIIDGRLKMIQIIQQYFYTLNNSITVRNVYCFSSVGEKTEIISLEDLLKRKKTHREYSFRGKKEEVIHGMTEFIKEHKDSKVLVLINVFLNSSHSSFSLVSQYKQNEEYSDLIYMELLKLQYDKQYQKKHCINPDNVEFLMYSPSSVGRSLMAVLLRENYTHMQEEMEKEILQNQRGKSSRDIHTVKTNAFIALDFPYYSTPNIYWCKNTCEEMENGELLEVDRPLALPYEYIEYIKKDFYQQDQDEEKANGDWLEQLKAKRYKNLRNYYHYTSLSTAWAILKNDSLRASHARFSNDSEELKNGMAIMSEVIREKYAHDNELNPLIGFLETLNASKIDSYIVCFCGSDDKLSQWRGYCREDGVCFGFAFGDTIQYYFADNPRQDMMNGTLQKVYYIGKNMSSVNNALERLQNRLQRELEDGELDYVYDRKFMEDILISLIPLVKDPGFQEEEESRLVVINGEQTLPNESGNPLDFLIQYRQDENGIQRPYISICFGKRYDNTIMESEPPSIHLYGISGKMRSMITQKFPKYTIEQKKAKEDPYILVDDAPEMIQKKALADLEEIKRNYYSSRKKESDNISIWFEGHLPIRTITVSPCINQEEVIESFRHYCTHEKFWLKYVKVQGSTIPYRRPNNK